jgi:hypothetical protein
MHSLPNRAGGAPSRPCRRCPRLLPGQRRSLPAAHRCGPAESLQNRVGPPHGWSAVGRGLKRRTSNRLVNIARRRQPNVPPLRPERTLPRNLHTSLGQAPFPRGTVLWRFGDSVPRFADLGLGTGLDSTTTHTVSLRAIVQRRSRELGTDRIEGLLSITIYSFSSSEPPAHCPGGPIGAFFCAR